MKKLNLEEAVKVLEDMKVKIAIPKAAELQRKRNEAIDMAIEALSSSEIPNNSDTISRHGIFDKLRRIIESTDTNTKYNEGFRDALAFCMSEIVEMPPAEPEPKAWRWIDDGTELGCQCPKCGKSLDEYINCGTEYMTLTEIPKFCPNCGADMRKKVEND